MRLRSGVSQRRTGVLRASSCPDEHAQPGLAAERPPQAGQRQARRSDAVGVEGQRERARKLAGRQQRGEVGLPERTLRPEHAQVGQQDHHVGPLLDHAGEQQEVLGRAQPRRPQRPHLHAGQPALEALRVGARRTQGRVAQEHQQRSVAPRPRGVVQQPVARLEQVDASGRERVASRTQRHRHGEARHEQRDGHRHRDAAPCPRLTGGGVRTGSR